MTQPTEPLTDEQLTEIRDWLEGCKGAERAEIPAHLRRYETWLGGADGRAILLLAEVDRLRAQLDLAQELYVRVPIAPLSHVVVRRDRAGVDLWAVTDGALAGLHAWVDGRWQYVGDVGRAAAFRWSLEGALALAEDAAAAEARSYADARSKEQQT